MTLEEDRARLAIPPGPESAPALARLAERGDIDAAWTRAHYLLDLFDDARFRREGESLSLLGRAIGAPDLGRGRQATDRAVDALLVEVDRVLGHDRLHAAGGARTLLEFDARPPVERAQVYQRMVELKAIAGGGGPISGNARLRLFGYCRRAFEDAIRAPPRHRSRLLAHCLYPLFDSDPEPYFAEDPARRPPPPRWQALRAEALSLLERIEDLRLAPAAAAQREAFESFLETNAGALPEVPEPDALAIPSAPRATPYDWTPILELGDASSLEPAASSARALAPRIEADGRGALALSLDGAAPAAALRRAAEAALEAGALKLELLVTTEQRLVVPPGDYWAERSGDSRLMRRAVVPLSLAPLGATAPADAPRAAGWDPSRAQHELHLVVEAERWRLVSPGGELGRFEPEAAKLREALLRVRGAFPEEDGLILVPGEGASYADVVAAAAAAAHEESGRRLFSRLALGLEAPEVRGRGLVRRIERRYQAAVRIEPDALLARRGAVRACYQDLLEERPRLGGTFRLELRAGEAVIVAGPRHRRLRACVERGVGPAMADGEVASVEVELIPRP